MKSTTFDLHLINNYPQLGSTGRLTIRYTIFKSLNHMPMCFNFIYSGHLFKNIVLYVQAMQLSTSLSQENEVTLYS